MFAMLFITLVTLPFLTQSVLTGVIGSNCTDHDGLAEKKRLIVAGGLYVAYVAWIVLMLTPIWSVPGDDKPGSIFSYVAGGFFENVWMRLFSTLIVTPPILLTVFQTFTIPIRISMYFLGKISIGRKLASAPGSALINSYPARKPRATFSNVSGMRSLKEELAAKFAEIKAGNGNGILLHGAPGNGKTLIAESIAGELGCKFLPVNWGTVASRWIGQTSEQVIEIFKAAHAQSPCVLFIDEADALLADRSGMQSGNSEDAKVVTLLLNLLQDYHDVRRSGVVIIAATNHLDRLDPAAVREGRFDFKTQILNPDYEARLGLLQRGLAKGLSFEAGAVERAARRWEGFSVSRLLAVGNNVNKLCESNGLRNVGFTVLMEALRMAQGDKGSIVQENALSLSAMTFDPAMREQLKGLSRRLIDIEHIENLGGTVPKGVIFHGPPGTGKTATAKALAKDSGWAFIATSGQDLFSSPKELDALVSKASDLRPCIVFIDEADDLLCDRARSFNTQAINKFLALMDGNQPLHDVLFIAATNNPAEMDAAITRDGRFGEHFEFAPPKGDALLALVREFIESKKNVQWANEFTPEAVAFRMEGMPPSDVKGRLQQVINRCIVKTDYREIRLSDLEDLL